jgi:ribose 5-phosphate isomerase A
VTPADDAAHEKRVAAEAAAALVPRGAKVGLGTGSTVAYLLPALAERDLDLRCAATSPATESVARGLGLVVEPLDELGRLDLAIDGADQVAPDCWLVKGGGGAHTREKRVAEAADRFVVIVSADKLVDRLSPPVPLELEASDLEQTLAQLRHAEVRSGAPRSPDAGVIADYQGVVGDPVSLSTFFALVPGVVEHGLFPPNLVSEVLVARGDEIERVECNRRFRRFDHADAGLA